MPPIARTAARSVSGSRYSTFTVTVWLVTTAGPSVFRIGPNRQKNRPPCALSKEGQVRGQEKLCNMTCLRDVVGVDAGLFLEWKFHHLESSSSRGDVYCFLFVDFFWIVACGLHAGRSAHGRFLARQFRAVVEADSSLRCRHDVLVNLLRERLNTGLDVLAELLVGSQRLRSDTRNQPFRLLHQRIQFGI